MIYRMILFFFLITMLSPLDICGQEMKIRINSPGDGTAVVQRPTIEGAVTDSKAKVSVIVHPMEVSDYWVQPNVTVREDGRWRVIVYIGRPGPIDVGKHFEIMAVANHKDQLGEGQVLKDWPEAKAKSQVIEVIRK